MESIDIDCTISASDCLGYCPVQKDFVALADLKDGEIKGMKRRIVAISEGVHNGIQFRASEIEEMVQASNEQKTSENRSVHKAPLVVDHSDRIIDKVGNTFALEYSTDPANDNPAALADVEFWAGTPMLDEVVFRVHKDPENTFFSVRVRGEWMKDDDGEYLSHLKLIHIAVVNEPADSNARILGELSENNGQSDFSLNNQQEESPNMVDATDTIKELQKEVAELKKENADLKASEAELDDRVQLMSEILATDPAIDKDFIKSMSKDQLTQYKAELERAATAAAEKKSTERSMSSGGDVPTPEDLAKKFYGVDA